MRNGGGVLSQKRIVASGDESKGGDDVEALSKSDPATLGCRRLPLGVRQWPLLFLFPLWSLRAPPVCLRSSRCFLRSKLVLTLSKSSFSSIKMGRWTFGDCAARGDKETRASAANSSRPNSRPTLRNAMPKRFRLWIAAELKRLSSSS